MNEVNIQVIKNKKECDDKLKLNNGDLIFYKDHIAYICSHEDGPNYCALIDLKTGCRVCNERCSRNTTKYRVSAHLRSWGVIDGKKYGNYKVNESKIEIFKRSQYNMIIEISECPHDTISDNCGGNCGDNE